VSGTPKVSVLLATRNGARFLEAALASLAAQTFSDFELIAVDDGSSDRSGALLERCAVADARVRVLRTPGVGLAGALALAAGSARGSYFARWTTTTCLSPRARAAEHPTRMEVAVPGPPRS
jgi:glycosyltransferase involved in cell wall biosynthesis